jgi:hypothetical protein
VTNIVAETGKGIVKLASLIGLLATTERALRSWINKRSAALITKEFEKEAVKKRKVYVDLGHGDRLDRFLSDLRVNREALLWISGSGGTGKSTLAFEVARRVADDKLVVPVIVDSGSQSSSIQDYTAKELTVDDSEGRPGAFIVQKLLKKGIVLLVVDGLSEIAEKAAKEIIAGFERGDICHIVISSRDPCPYRENAHQIELGNMRHDQLETFVAKYVQNSEQREPIVNALRDFSMRQDINPLFARIAIEEASRGQDLPQSKFELVQKYIQGLRTAIPSSPSEADFWRACRLAAFSCLDSSFTPHDVSEDYLRGVLDADASRSAFYDERGSKLDPHTLITFLRTCGLLKSILARAVQRIDFVYHPVAEYLAAAHVASLPEEGRKQLLKQIGSTVNASSTFVGAVEETLGYSIGTRPTQTKTATSV